MSIPICVRTAGLFVAMAWGAVVATAQEPSGLQAAMALEKVLVDTIARAEPSVVSIARFNRQDIETNQVQPFDPEAAPSDYATGVVIDAAGLILTTYHSLGDPDSSQYYITTGDRRQFQAALSVRGADPRSDLAVLKVVDASSAKFTPISFGDAKTLKKGAFVLALGNPYAIARDGQASASWGIVSNLARKAAPVPAPNTVKGEAKPTLAHFGTLIQTDLRLKLGSSGGPLLNLKGEMVGLTTSAAALVGHEQAAGYAIPVDDTFRRVVRLLSEGREVDYGFLGISPANLTEQERKRGEAGVRVMNVVAGTPAAKAGLIFGDVIRSVDGQAVHDTDGLFLHVGKLSAGSPTRLAVTRDGQLVQKNVTLTKMRVEGKRVVTAKEPAWRGLRVDFPTAVMATRVGAQYPDGCVTVSEVDESSPAWKLGVRRGWLISHVGGVPVETPREFYDAARGGRDAVKLKLVVPFQSPNPADIVIPASAVGG